MTTIGKLVNEVDKGTEYNIDPTLLPKVVDAFDVISQKLNVYGTQMTDQDWAIIAKVAVKKKDKAKETEKEQEVAQPEVPPTADAPDTPAEPDESEDLFTIDDDDEPMIDLDGGSNETATPSEPSDPSDPSDDMVLRDDDDDDDDDDDGAIGHLTR